MILAAGLSPAWQQIVCLPELRPGEVNRARETHWCASGKVLNVGLALGSLGAAQCTLAPLGGSTGQAIAQEFAGRGVHARWVQTDAPTRVCTTLLAQADERATEIVENARPLRPSEVRACAEAFVELAQAATVVVWTGSQPPGVPIEFVRELLARVHVPALLDIRGPELQAALPGRPLLVKPNREELAATLGRPLETEADVLAAAQEVRERGAQWVLVSQGAGAALLVGSGARYRVHSLRVQRVVNPIACGDCLAAGIAWGLSQGESVASAVQLGVAAAAANAATLLPARLDPVQVRAASRRVELEPC